MKHMPELPEVETVRQTLQPKLAGLKFCGARVYLPKIIKTPDPEEFVKEIKGKKIIKLSRRGKYLLLHLSDRYNLVVHLRMTGSLVYCDNGAPPARHTHVIFDLSNGAQLHFTDVLQFGQLWLVPCTSLDSLTGLKNLGVEPLEPQFTRDYLKRELRRRHARIKPLLLDQTIIAGLGNIYTDEALHRAKINPERLATTLTPREIASLYRAIKDVLQEGIDSRGTTVRNYVDGEGQSGSYQEQLRVYSREGEPCSHCGKTIVKKKVGGRSSYYCPACQKAR
jgi:formamidopyrimidine-DNA glycosylase